MKKIIIVGAGIAGLSSAVYLQRSGFEVTLIEKHTIVGGMCTSWRRKGYLFEGAMHWLTGSKPGTDLNRMWREVGALDDSVAIFTPEIFRTVEWQGQTVHLYRSAEKTRDALLRDFPEDAKAIHRLYKHIKKLGGLQMPATDIKGLKAETPSSLSLGDMGKLLPALSLSGKSGKISVEQYLEGFSSPALRALLGSVVPDNYTANSLLFTLATLDTGDGGFPEGGSLAFVQRMQKAFTSLGGTLLLGRQVKRVVVENGRATGVRLEGETLQADAVIVAAETKAALENLFDKIPDEKWLTGLCSDVKPSACTFVGIGVRAVLADTPIFQLEKPLHYAGHSETSLGLNNYSGYKGQAPEGCTTLTAILMGDTYDFWHSAKQNGTYEAEKQALATQIETALCTKWPALAGKIDVIDIATPVTYERYTGAYHGSWMSVVEPGDKMKQYPGDIESISGLYFAGHRLMPPGGLPGALATGRTAAQLVCRQFDAVFR